ncbi:hypothetical protein E2C01_083930 [Portunus trituberculatus]|uniref:Uncharacterized protein n=1 Tax=Portunus trituberculatus TaxID=210409 RepID=A0A5B7IYD3_PORTR|nr:hypothetical protein [Portunus trituberculatus]
MEPPVSLIKTPTPRLPRLLAWVCYQKYSNSKGVNRVSSGCFTFNVVSRITIATRNKRKEEENIRQVPRL